MKYGIVGSRDFNNLPMVGKWMRANLKPGDIVVSGGARGVDSEAACVADEMGLVCIVYEADWNSYGKRAGFVRNELIVDQADVIVAFWDGVSKGTKHTIDLAKKAGKRVLLGVQETGRKEEIVKLFQERRYRR